MSHLPEGPSGCGPWLGFAAVYGVLCFFFPPLLGIALGCGKIVVLAYVFYRLLGGKGPLVG
jgi:hypothetical protein